MPPYTVQHMQQRVGLSMINQIGPQLTALECLKLAWSTEKEFSPAFASLVTTATRLSKLTMVGSRNQITLDWNVFKATPKRLTSLKLFDISVGPEFWVVAKEVLNLRELTVYRADRGSTEASLEGMVSLRSLALGGCSNAIGTSDTSILLSPCVLACSFSSR